MWTDWTHTCKYTLNTRPGALGLTPASIFFGRDSRPPNLDAVLQARRKGLQEKLIKKSLRRGKVKTDILEKGVAVRLETYALGETRRLGDITRRAMRHRGAL